MKKSTMTVLTAAAAVLWTLPAHSANGGRGLRAGSSTSRAPSSTPLRVTLPSLQGRVGDPRVVKVPGAPPLSIAINGVPAIPDAVLLADRQLPADERAAVEKILAEAARENLDRVEDAVGSVPDLGKVGDGDAKGAGASLSDALNGDRTVSGSGEPVPAAPQGDLKSEVAWAHGIAKRIRQEVGTVIIGQEEMLNAITMALIARQHVLLEGLPGVGKTETAKAFADAVQASFRRVQGTPDKLPPDILGSEILQEDPATGKKEFVRKLGPIFTDILLVDEINRMPPKAQAALLEGMAEKHVTIGNQSLELPKAFTVLATQNPVEQDGTYPLPEAQLDRFMFKVLVPQPNERELLAIMDKNESGEGKPKAANVATLAELDAVRKVAERIPLDDSLKTYIARIAMAAKEHPDVKQSVEYSVYVRAAIFMARAARIHALLAGRAFVGPQDVRAVAPLVLRHRIVLNDKHRELTPDQVIEKILAAIPMPRPQQALPNAKQAGR